MAIVEPSLLSLHHRNLSCYSAAGKFCSYGSPYISSFFEGRLLMSVAGLDMGMHGYVNNICKCLGQEESSVRTRRRKVNQENSKNSFKLFNQRVYEEEINCVYGLNADADNDADVLYEDDIQDACVLKSVVKVYCISAEPNYFLPWQLQRQQASSGSGFIISGRRLLTNAHCVEHYTQVTVKRTGDDTKYIATVLAIGPECDLALLTVDDDEFWEDVEPLHFGSLPYLQDAVTVVGYPIGGDTVSVSRGVVSRIEVTSYAHGDSELLALQIDAAINPGNSGGPALNDFGDCVGIAFQSYHAAENIGYVIPTPVILHFLKDYNLNKMYTGFPALGVSLQKIENPDLRASLKMRPKQKGVLIQRVEPTSPSKDVLKEGDVILSFDGILISNEATVPLRAGEQIAFSFLVSQKFTGDEAVLLILRDGKELELTTSLRPLVQLVPVHIKERHPSYFIVAGLVFTPVSESLLQEDGWGDRSGFEMKIRVKASYSMAEFEGEEIVMLSEVLAHAVNIGYEDLNLVQVLKFNGVKVRNTRHLAHLVDSCSMEYMRFGLDDNLVIVLSTNAARASTREILKDYCIPEDRSRDLRDCIDFMPSEH